MTQTVQIMLDLLRAGNYKNDRIDGLDITPLAEGCDALEQYVRSFEAMLAAEQPRLLPGDIWGFNRSQRTTPVFSCADGSRSIPAGTGNITPNYAAVIARGLDDILAEVQGYLPAADEQQARFYNAVQRMLQAILSLADRYRTHAEEQGNTPLAAALAVVPHGGAQSFYQALLFQKILIFALRCACYTHLTLGRFDQYMLPWYDRALADGATQQELLQLVELYFITLNMDSDLYFGVQQGDNGQSMVLGGFDLEGRDMYNGLSELCMTASLELCLIDPKINLRVGKNTPPERYVLATRLTKKGLGFPQYCNDDVVVPGLIDLGYEPQDACNYTVAACWEYIVPNCSFDIPNMDVMNFPLVTGRAIRKHLADCSSFDELLAEVRQAIAQESDRIILQERSFGSAPAPLLSVLVDGCIAKGQDISDGAAKYNCRGCHGAGIANAADALAAVKKYVFEEHSLTPQQLLEALEADFEGYTVLQNKLLDAPKMGNNDPYVDDIACSLMDAFATALNRQPTRYGGFWRAGTGSAMEYLWSAARCPATADGRRAGAPYGSSFSPAITTRLNGPLSVIQSFTRFDMRRIINGGPLTMEMHDSVFRNAEGEAKVASLVQLFIALGGHQLQLNAVDRDRLLAAQAHPERDPNLIVRVWGWSGYFCQLDKAYQDHIIARTEFR